MKQCSELPHFSAFLPVVHPCMTPGTAAAWIYQYLLCCNHTPIPMYRSHFRPDLVSLWHSLFFLPISLLSPRRFLFVIWSVAFALERLKGTIVALHFVPLDVLHKIRVPDFCSFWRERAERSPCESFGPDLLLTRLLDVSELYVALQQFLFLLAFVLEIAPNCIFRFHLLPLASLGTLVMLLEFLIGLPFCSVLSVPFLELGRLLLRLARHCVLLRVRSPVAISLSQIHKINIHCLSYSYSNKYSKQKQFLILLRRVIFAICCKFRVI